MSDLMAATEDPVFFMHHGFIDHNWRIWQNADPERLYQVGGVTRMNGKQILTLDYVLDSQGLWPPVTVADVMNTMGGYLCYKYNY